MQAWEEQQKPGPEHELLKSLAGEWNADVTTYAPDGSTQKSVGRETVRLVLAGRFIESHYAGTTMGKPYTGQGLVGFDKEMKKFISTWADSMTTGILVMYGDVSKDGKVITYYADNKGPDGKTEKWKSVTTIPDEKTRTFELVVMLADGKEMKVLSTVYTRVQ